MAMIARKIDESSAPLEKLEPAPATPPAPDTDRIADALTEETGPPSRLRQRSVRLGAALLAVLVAAVAYHYWPGRAVPPSYRLAPVTRGPITAAVIASGTVNPVISVQVGSQVSGQIKELYADFNTQVKTGQLIARIDPDIIETHVAQAQADLAVARANLSQQKAALERAKADIETARATLVADKAQTEKARATLVHARLDFERKQHLAGTGFGAIADRDAAKAALDEAAAQVGTNEAQEQSQAAIIVSVEAQARTAEANIESAEAQVMQKEAALREAQVNLEHTYIHAPVDGTVVLRNVDVGQTVAASLQAPLLFNIAQDLSAMQVDTSVDEADVGGVREGQRVRFTVDAYAGKTFEGNVVQVRKSPQVVQNVVTYDVVTSAPNPDLLLLPGLTANIRIITAERDSALKIPNAALRYRPAQVPAAQLGAPGRGRAYVLGSDGKPTPVELQLGITDGNFTEVTGGQFKEGDQVIVGEIAPRTGLSTQPGTAPSPRM